MNPSATDGKLSLLSEIRLDVRLEVGRASLSLRDVLALAPDSIVSLTRSAGSNLDLFVGERLVARGDLVAVDGNYALRVTEVHGA